VTVTPQLRVLTGISRPERWPELRPAALAAVLELARALAATVVVDTGFCLEQDEELSYDTAAPRRNAATLTALEAADLVVAVATADPVGLHRFVRGVAELREAVIPKQLLTVVNRVRRAAVGAGDPHREIGTALSRYAAIDDVRFIPLDVAAFDTMLATGRTLVEAAPKSPARQALRSLAQELSESPNPKATTRRRH
jgi:Flp pilus assembly CpaE family ATPase